MNEGKLYVRSYQAGNGQNRTLVVYKNISESESDSYRGLVNLGCFKSLNLDISSVEFSVDYIGPIRVAAQRSVYSSDIDDKNKVGYNGERTPYLLLDSYLGDQKLLKNVSDWYKDNMEGQWLDIVENGLGTGSYSLMMHRGGASVNLADVGEGHNQLLPVVTRSFASYADINIIEQPVLHLHPSAHANVAYRLSTAAVESGKKYLIESHSENFLLGLRKMVTEGTLRSEDVITYYIDHDENQAYVSEVEIERNGDLSYWPEGVFEEDFELLKAINRGQR